MMGRGRRKSREGQYTYVNIERKRNELSYGNEGGKVTVAIVTLNEAVSEIEDLAYSAGYQVLYEIIQKRGRPNARTFIGKGKLDEIKEIISNRPVTALLFNGDLKPSQHYLLENYLKVECIDRVRVVLNIFTERAHSRESQLQVLRAKLIYEIPLLREWIHNAKLGEHPGFLGAGEYETDAYYELIRRQLNRINSELQRLDMGHQLRRRQRLKRGFNTVAIAGYTNAGKSTLLNALTTEQVVVEDRLFSTLTTTTGRLTGESKPILVTDTIGFLERLPHFLIESFKSTIDEVYFSDLVLLVADASDSLNDFKRKLETSRDILFPETNPSTLIVILSKRDLASDIGAKRMMALNILSAREAIAVSSLSGEGLQELRRAISANFQYPVEMRFRLPHGEEVERLLSWLHAHTEVVQVKYGSAVEVHLFCQEKDHPRIVDRLVTLGGQPV
jgi:GTP-binding protein HflX